MKQGSYKNETKTILEIAEANSYSIRLVYKHKKKIYFLKLKKNY